MPGATANFHKKARGGKRGGSKGGGLSSGGRAIGKYADDAWSLARRTAAGLATVKRLINVDHKFIVSSASTTTSQAGVVTYLLPIGQGVDYNQRIGDSIRVQFMELRLNVTRNGSDGSARILVFRDTENRQANPAGTDLLTAAGAVTCTVSTYNYFNKNPNAEKNRFVILYDEAFAITSNSTNVLDCSVMLGKHVRFTGTGNTSASAGEGALFIAMFTDLAANAPIVNWSFGIYYTDD